MLFDNHMVLPRVCNILSLASTSEKNALSDSDTVAESYDDLTVINEADFPIHLCSYFSFSVISSLQLFCVCSFVRIIGE